MSYISEAPAGRGRATASAAVASGVKLAITEVSFEGNDCRCQGILRTNGDDRDVAKFWTNGGFLCGITLANGDEGNLLRMPLDPVLPFLAFKYKELLP